jgi:hypothetical protein
VLATTDAYPDWSPCHVRVDGPLDLGARLTVDIEKPNSQKLTIHPHVLELVPGRSLVWGGAPRLIFYGEDRFDLEPLSPGCTRLRHSEVFSGLFIRFAHRDAIEEGYVAMNEALRRRVVARASAALEHCG